MAAIKGTNTAPERAVRSLLHRLGYRFRLHRRDLPGRPDIVLPRLKIAIFVHGCFWHRHNCANSVLPRTRAEWWEAKLNRTVERDRQQASALTALGWNVVILWECMLDDETSLRATLEEVLGPARARTP
jgi:DNA mismatch endonuclease (patch repair protein)